VLVDFTVECVAERNDVGTSVAIAFQKFLVVVPELHGIKKVEPARTRDGGWLVLLFRTKENRGAKDALKSLYDSTVVVSVLGEFKVVKQL
jgi:hypothetical protein